MSEVVSVVISDGQVSVWGNANEAASYAEKREAEGMSTSLVTDIPVQTLVRVDLRDTYRGHLPR